MVHMYSCLLGITMETEVSSLLHCVGGCLVCNILCNIVCNANTGPGILANKNTRKISQSEFVIFPINSENQVKWIHFNA